MISFYDLKEITCEEILAQSVPDTSKAEQAVKEIIAAVREKGDEALYFYNEKFDGKTSSLKVTQEEIDRAVKNTDPYFLETLRQARDNISEYHSAQIRKGYEIKRGACVLGQKITPLAKVGLYVPGGTANKKRRLRSGTDNNPSRQGRTVRSRRYRPLSVHGTYERNSRPSCRGQGNSNGHPSRQERKRSRRYLGRSVDKRSYLGL